MVTPRTLKNQLMGIFCFLLFCISTTLTIVGCAPDKPIILGFVGGLTGRVADLGISGRNGAILAVENINNSGGVNGRKVKLVVMDDKQNNETAEQVVRKLIAQGVIAIIGPMTSSMAMQTVPIANEQKVIMMSPTTTTTFLSGKNDYFFRISNTTKVYATIMARHLYDNLGIREVAVVYDLGNKAYTESWMEDFRKEFENSGGRIAAVVTFHSSQDTHLYEVARQAMLPGVDALVISASAMDTAMLFQQVKKTGEKITIATSEWASTEKFLEFGGAAVEGAIVSQFFDRNSTDHVYVKFRKDYNKRFGNEPGFASVNAYDAVNVVLDAMKKQKNGKLAKETLQKFSQFHGVQGLVKIDQYGDADRKTFISVVENNKFVVVE